MKRKKFEFEVPVPDVDLGSIGETIRQLVSSIQQKLVASQPEPSAKLMAALARLERVRVNDRRKLVLLTFRGSPPIHAAAEIAVDGLLRLASTAPEDIGRSGTIEINSASGYVQAASAVWQVELGELPPLNINARSWHLARMHLASRDVLIDFPERFARAWAEWQRYGRPADLIGHWDPELVRQPFVDEPPRTGPRATGPGSRAGQSRRQAPPPPRPGPSVPDYYAELELSSNATIEEIRRAYRRLARKYHPDTTAEPRDRAATRFRRVQEAYEVLSDTTRRAEYDRKRKRH